MSRLLVSVEITEGLEASARKARYAALDSVGDTLNAVAIFLGHTRDDQAESVLLGLGLGLRIELGLGSGVRNRFIGLGL